MQGRVLRKQNDLTHNSQKYLEVNLGQEILKGFFHLKIRIFKLWEMPESLNFRLPEG